MPAKFLRIPLSLLLLCTLLLPGCQRDEALTETAAPVKSTIEYNHTFRITCLSSQYEYDSRQMEKEAPLHFELLLEYIGEEPSVTIWHRMSIGAIEFLHANRESVLPIVVGDVLASSVLEKGEVCTVSVSTGAREYEVLGGLSRGDYIAFAFVDFEYGPDAEEHVFCTLELPFAIV